MKQIFKVIDIRTGEDVTYRMADHMIDSIWAIGSDGGLLIVNISATYANYAPDYYKWELINND